MKYLGVFITALFLGYFAYKVFNQTNDRLMKVKSQKMHQFLEEEARRYAESTDPDEKLKAARDMYNKMNVLIEDEYSIKGPEDRLASPVQNKRVTKTATSPKSSKKLTVTDSLKKKPAPENKTIADKISANSLDQKTAMGLGSLPDIPAMDARIKKLQGSFVGKLTRKGPSRTGVAENITLEVNQDPDKKMTRLEVVDNYDNVDMNVNQLTSYSFKSVPGDENMLLLSIPGGSVILNLKGFPKLQGKVFTLEKLTAEFDLDKTDTKSSSINN